MTERQVTVAFPRGHCVVDDHQVIVYLTHRELQGMLDEIDAKLRGIRELPTAMRELQVRMRALPVKGRG